MSSLDQQDFWPSMQGPRLPRIALMGEFSAGKSTLANMMIGQNPLPVQVVATRLPPVWICYGEAPSRIVDLAGNETPCVLEALEEIDPEEIAFIRIFCQQEILKKCEIIDMPGISDPNMSSRVWERMIPFADGVLWCSPATQAWRQSEAAVWSSIDPSLYTRSLLVLTRGDMLVSERDKAKVMQRVRGEAARMFADILMISLAFARDAGDDEELWKQSGADAFVARFLDLLAEISNAIEKAGGGSLQSFPDARSVAKTEENEALDAVAVVQPRRPVVRRPMADRATDPPVAQPDPSSYSPKFS